MRPILPLIVATASFCGAQDFYNGQPGPCMAQMDLHASYTSDEITGVMIPKIFTKRFLIAAPFALTESGVSNQGVNFGLIKRPSKDNLGIIAALGLFKDGKSKYSILNPQIYTTIERGKTSVDLEVAAPRNLRTGSQGWHGAATLGYGLTDRLRVGGSASWDAQSKPAYQGIARIELTKNHHYWLQFYAGRAHAGMRLVINR